jgi:hypothetical protein
MQEMNKYLMVVIGSVNLSTLLITRVQVLQQFVLKYVAQALLIFISMHVMMVIMLMEMDAVLLAQLNMVMNVGVDLH